MSNPFEGAKMDRERTEKEALQAAEDNARRAKNLAEAKARTDAVIAKIQAEKLPVTERPSIQESESVAPISLSDPHKINAGLKKIFGGDVGLAEAKDDAARRDYHYRKEHKDF